LVIVFAANRASRLARPVAVSGTSGKVYPADRATLLFEAIIEPGDRVIGDALRLPHHERLC
jgi:hypothetical protein